MRSSVNTLLLRSVFREDSVVGTTMEWLRACDIL